MDLNFKQPARCDAGRTVSLAEDNRLVTLSVLYCPPTPIVVTASMMWRLPPCQTPVREVQVPLKVYRLTPPECHTMKSRLDYASATDERRREIIFGLYIMYLFYVSDVSQEYTDISVCVIETGGRGLIPLLLGGLLSYFIVYIVYKV
jgi:hypothetical protein